MRSCLALLLLLAAQVAGAQSMNLLHSERSLYREVLVYEAGSERCMCFVRQCRIGRQTCLDPRRPDHVMLNYTQMMLGALLVKPEPASVLIIGLGGGTIPRALQQLLPATQVEVVEIDPAVVRVAKQYFHFKDGRTAAGGEMRVVEADGRVHVKRAIRERRQFDMVMLDAFDHEYIPEHLLTREFLQEVKSLLAPGGVLVANTFSSSRLYDYESATYAAVFPEFFNLKRENRVIIAANGPLPTREQLQAASETFEPAFKRLGFSTARILPLFSRERDWKEDARVLTDQYSPANLLNLD